MKLKIKNSKRCSLSAVRPYSAFTMIEIAISLAVIAFALVAIIGVLPTGLTVQKDNREDTIINQDGPYWVEAIRNGAKGLDHLTNYVERIAVITRPLNSTNLANITFTTNFNQYDDLVSNRLQSGSNIVGLLSLPKWSIYSYNGSPQEYVVRVEAQTRALSGSAVEQGTNNADLAFSYLLVSEVIPYNLFPYDSTNWFQHSNDFVAHIDAGGSSNSPAGISLQTRWKDSYERWQAAPTLHANVHEARLTFRWPLVGGGRTGPNYQRFRTMISGRSVPVAPDSIRFFQPQTFGKQ